jgi:DNA-binding NarL/FixJ family response regulator
VLAVGCPALVGLGLDALLAAGGLVLAGAAPDVDAAIALEAGPDALLVDLAATGDVRDAVHRLEAVVPAARLVAWLSPFDEQATLEALAAGARCCVAVDAPAEELLAGLRAALRDGTFVSPRIARRLARRLGLAGAAPAKVELTAREREVLALIARGHDNASVAATLHLSRATVKHHVAAVFAKLGVANRVQAAVRAARDDLVDL